MGLQVASSKAANAAGKSLVFAVSGAGTGEGTGRQVKEALLGYGMINQVRDFAARVKSGEIAFDPQTTLFFLAGGLNDGKRETAITLANLRQELQILRELGGRHFTIALLPTKIPQFAAVGLRLNPAYEQFVREEAGAAGLDLWLNHWGTAFDEVMDHPAAHGIVNTTSACAGRAIFDQDPTPVGDPATYSSTMRVIPRRRCIESWGRSCSRRLRRARQRRGEILTSTNPWRPATWSGTRTIRSGDAVT